MQKLVFLLGLFLSFIWYIVLVCAVSPSEDGHCFIKDRDIVFSIQRRRGNRFEGYIWWETEVCCGWYESLIGEYKKIPPLEVLKRLKEEKQKGKFDYFTIATLEEREPIKDPILLGRIKNSSTRFFLNQWGLDILLDDLI